MSEEHGGFREWAILELMGHRRLAGMVTEVAIGGGSMLRIDVPRPDGKTLTTQFYSASAVYCITPTTEEIARGLAERSFSPPVTRYELPAPEPARDEEFVQCEGCRARVPVDSKAARNLRYDDEGVLLCPECYEESAEAEGEEMTRPDNQEV